MKNSDRQSMSNDVENSINQLDFNFKHSTSDYREGSSSIVEVDVDISQSDSWPEDWDETLEKALSIVAKRWGASLSWDGWRLALSVFDE